MKEKSFVSVPFMTGKHGEASVVLMNVTFVLENDLTKRYCDPDFGAWLLEEIYNRKRLFAVKKGFFKKSWWCPSCRTEICADTQAPHRIEYELKYKDFAPFSIQITIPSVECPECKKICGVDQNGSLGYHLNEAIIQAFKSENIKP